MAEVLTKPSRRIRNMVAKELRLIIKDKVAILLIFLLPAVLIGMLWYVTNESGMGGLDLGGGMGDFGGGGDDDTNETSTTTIPIDVNETLTEDAIILGIVDLDTGPNTYEYDLSENLTAYFEMMVDEIVVFNSTADAYRALYEARIDVYVVIPSGFESNLTIN